MAKATERRKNRRIRLNDVLKLGWVDREEKFFTVKAPCLDASETGVRVEIRERIDPSSFVNIKADQYGLTASARVRRVIQTGLRYQVGLEFNSSHSWKNLPELSPSGSE